MFQLTARLEDTSIVALEQRVDTQSADGDTELSLICHDFITGRIDSRPVTHLQLGAILALAFGGEDFPEEVTKALYAIAEPALAGQPTEVRPIP